MNYSGTTKFIYNHECIIDNIESIVPLSVKGRAYYQAGNYNALPENSYPDEGDVEILSITGPDNKDWYDLISSDEEKEILEIIKEQVQGDF